MTDNLSTTETSGLPGGGGADPALLEALRLIATSLDQLRPLLHAANVNAPASLSTPRAEPAPRSPSQQQDCNVHAVRDSAPTEPTAADLLKYTAPTETRLAKLANAERKLNEDLLAGGWLLTTSTSRLELVWLLQRAQQMQRWPKSFGHLSDTSPAEFGGPGGVDIIPASVVFVHSLQHHQAGPTRGASHHLDAQDYPTVTPILDRQNSKDIDAYECPAHGRSW